MKPERCTSIALYNRFKYEPFSALRLSVGSRRYVYMAEFSISRVTWKGQFPCHPTESEICECI